MIWVQVALWAASFVLSALLAPSPSIREPSAAGLRDVRVPTTDAQRPIPWVCGRVLVRDPNLVWYGDFRARSIREKVKTGLFSSKRVTVGYEYFLGWHYVVCLSNDAAPARLREIRVEDSTILSGVAGPGAYTINARGLFGGYKSGGGISGTVDVLEGGSAQAVNGYLQSRLGDPQPAYRGVTSVVARQINIGETEQLRPIAMLVERYPDPAGTGQHVQVSGDANPAWAILELLTDPDVGLGYAIGRADQAEFLAAAGQLAAEGQGYSYEWQRQGEVQDLILQILEQIDATLYDDPVTGLFVLRLVRDDYVFSELPVLDRSNIIEVREYRRPTLDELPSEVTVVWTDRDTAYEQRATVHNLGVSAAQGNQVVARTRQHPGIGRADLANRVAERDLGTLGRPLARVELTLHSDVGMSLRPGDAVRWQWPEYGVEDLVLRIGQIDYGELTRTVVRVTAVEDAFRDGSGIYAPPPPTAWQPVAPEPAPVADWWLEPITWWHTQALELDWSVDDTVTGLAVAAAAPTANSLSYDLDLLRGSEWDFVAPEVPFSPRVTLATDVTPAQSSIGVDGLTALDADIIQPGTLAWLGGELCRVDALDADTGTVTLARGCVDTVATRHLAGTALYLAEDGLAAAGPVEIGSTSETVRAVTLATSGRLDTAQAPQLSESNVPGRHRLPYAPGQLRLQATAYPEFIVGELGLSWAHRDRLAQGGELVGEAAGSRGPEAGVTYTLRLYGETDTLLRTETGLTGTSYSYVDEGADSGLPGGRRNNLVRLELEAERDTLTSWTRHDVTTRRVGYGYSYGYSYGGL